MATLPTIAFVPTTAAAATASAFPINNRRVSFMTRASKGTAGSAASEEKGLLDFILGGLAKQDQFYETDPILAKVDEVEPKKGTGSSSKTTRGTVSVTPPPKKNNGGLFGGLFPNK